MPLPFEATGRRPVRGMFAAAAVFVAYAGVAAAGFEQLLHVREGEVALGA